MVKKSRVFYKLLALFLTVAILITIGAILPMHLTFTRSLQQSIEQNNYSTFTTFSERIDNELEKLEQLALSITFNSATSQFCNAVMSGKKFNTADITSFRAVENMISSIANVTPAIEDIMVYSTVNHYIITVDGNNHRITEPEGVYWYDSYQNHRYNTWQATDTIPGSLYMLKRYSSFSTSTKGVVILQVSLEHLFSEIPSEERAAYSMSITDRQGNLLLTNKNPVVNLSDKTLTTTFTSRYAAFTYTIENDLNTLWQPIQHMGLFALMITLLVLIGGFLLSYQFSRISYSPIYQTAAIVREAMPSDAVKPKDEFDTITTTVSSMQEQVSTLRTSLSVQQTSIRTQFIHNLCSGYAYSQEQLCNLFTGLEIEPHFQTCCITTLTISRADLYSISPSEKKLLLHRLLLLIRELLPVNQKILVSDFQGYEAPVLLLFDDSFTYADWVSLTGMLAKQIYERIGLHVFLCIGSEQSSILKTSLSYEHAALAGNRHFFNPDEVVCVYSPEDNQLVHEPLKLSADIFKYVRLIKTDDEPGLEQLLRSTFGVLQDTEPRYPKEFIIHALINHVVNILDAIKAFETAQQAYQEAYHFIATVQCLEQFYQWAPAFLLSVTQHSVEDGGSKKSKRASEMIAYIDNHFTQELSLDALADLFGISKSYVSQTINGYLGTSLTSYVNRLRIQQAKKLMLEYPGINLQSLSQQTGFNSVHTFLRAFKKEEGITPAQFKANNE